MSVKIITGLVFTDTKKPAIAVVTDYHPDFPKRARDLGGRWDPHNKRWLFDARDESDVRELCKQIYGTDGETPVDLVDVELTLESDHGLASIFAFGREIAWRPGRDAAVRLGEGVRLLEGSFPSSAGSRRYPVLGNRRVKLLVRDVPRSLIDEARRKFGENSVVIRGETPEGIPEAFKEAFGEEK